jgi:hypothetical protein
MRLFAFEFKSGVEAVHPPVHLETTEKGSAIGSAFFLGNPKAVNLQGKELIYEFALRNGAQSN